MLQQLASSGVKISNMKLLIFVMLLVVASSKTIDPTLTSTSDISKKLEDIFSHNKSSVNAEESVIQNGTINGKPCLCVPFYLCDNNDIYTEGIVYVDRYTIGEDLCDHYSKVCCTKPKEESEIKPQPKAVKGCGYRNPEGFGNFTKVEKEYSKFGEFPWMVALLDSRNNTYAGAGVLISAQVVMTVAHIAGKYSPEILKVRAGEWDSISTKEVFKHEERKVKDIYIHEDFKKSTLYNDIALLRLDSPLVLAELINVICLPEQDEVFDRHKNCVANGWGKDVFGNTDKYSVILKKVELNMVTNERCGTLLKKTRLGERFNLHDSFICAGGEEEDTCRGDGGAPLACPIGDDRYKLTGLVAWGIGCGGKDAPAVYTNVPKFRNWVDDKMKQWEL